MTILEGDYIVVSFINNHTLTSHELWRNTLAVATAHANSNIAFIKYWGNSDNQLRLPANPSISMNLNGLFTKTTVRWDESLASDVLTLNHKGASGEALSRVSKHMDSLRDHLKLSVFADITSENNFPTGAGIASSASAFAALTVAAVAATDQNVSERTLTTLARLGSGSASRSVPDGFVEWYTGETHESSFAESFAPSDYWSLVDVIAIVSDAHKAVVSKVGHTSANTSDLQAARVSGARDRLQICKQAIIDQDFATFAEVVERDSNLMHAVMMTSKPPLFYWKPASLAVMGLVTKLRLEGINVCYTLDAGPNVHCLCLASDVENVQNALNTLGDTIMDVRTATTGSGATVIDTNL